MINLDAAPNGFAPASGKDVEGFSFLSSASVSTAAGSTGVAASRGSGGYVTSSLDASSSSASLPPFVQRWFTGARHPAVCLFHLCFKIAALATYLAGGCLLLFLSDGEIFIFVTTLVFLVLDFWTVKNVSGRILVGMRWWSSVDAAGNSHWVFERAEDGREVNTVEWRVFWFGSYAWAATWLVLSVMKLLELQLFWFLLCAVGLTLATTNLMAYQRCSSQSGVNPSAFRGLPSLGDMPQAAGSAAQGIRDWLAAQAGAAAVQNVLGRVGLGGPGRAGGMGR
ncbi:hypothetical protein BESB_080220 [Besnoitia besnoiti]|uniref:Golgi apparatus membrane protein TVP23 homolog n=1 Tax=Besnoitia besnoiti TaxID=94643 RepID=A0A2A9MCY2_BESBE|nr:hypothetical protein BESB_080220 [Besnoitia besnoiti]PFH33806.1 hypothetical protein BESB_080220 [Besnoitia besnoiti]